VFNEILDDYKYYGFKDTTSRCAKDDCFWADTIHPGRRVHEILANDLAHALEMAGNLTNVLNVL
jgi:phospholipase/lecithinase/hemolysin